MILTDTKAGADTPDLLDNCTCRQHRGPQTSSGPPGLIRLDAEVLVLSEARGPADRSETSPACCLSQRTSGGRGEEVGVGRNQRVETYCFNLKRS